MSMTGSTNSFCPNLDVGIESALAPLGCIFNDQGDIIGKVFVCKKTEDAIDATPQYELIAYFNDGSDPIAPYTGTWKDCNYCPTDDMPSGFVTQF